MSVVGMAGMQKQKRKTEEGARSAKEANGAGANGNAGTKKWQESPSIRKSIAIVGIIVIFMAIAGTIVLEYGINGSQQANFLTFRNNFNSAPRVAIYAVAQNDTGLSSAIGCSTQLIEQLIMSSTQHRNASTINYYVMNATACSYSGTALGGSGSAVNTTPSSCLSMGAGEPRIFVNYSEINGSVVTSDALYIHGNSKFMMQCGIASEISAG